MTELVVAKNPCSSCPYRKDVPSGVWAKEEYEKLRAFDDNTCLSTFLCHNGSPEHPAACKGWVVVHTESVAVRLAVAQGVIPGESRYELPTVPLYESGYAAADAGEKAIQRPGRAAKKMVQKLVRGSRKRAILKESTKR